MPVNNNVPPVEAVYHLIVFAPLGGVAEIVADPDWHNVAPDTERGAEVEFKVTVTAVRIELSHPLVEL